jgi:ligand-binding sensor domain-containing protein
MALLLLCLGGLNARAVVGERWDFGSRLWRTDDGLPNNSVQAIAQTRDDYLWVGTREGVARFDGIHFQTFPEVPNVSITALAEDGGGTLWIGTGGAGILRWRAGHVLPPLTGAAPTNAAVMTMLPGRDGAMWVGTTDGLWEFQNGEAKEFYKHQRVRSLSQDAEGTVWAAIGDGSKKYQPATHADPTGMKSVTARVVLSGQNGAMWVGSSGGVNEITRDEPVSFTKKGGLAADMVSALFEDRAGDLWIGTFGGLNCMRSSGRARRSIRRMRSWRIARGISGSAPARGCIG